MNAYAYVPFNLECYAESILPVTGIDMQALCTRNNGGAGAGPSHIGQLLTTVAPKPVVTFESIMPD